MNNLVISEAILWTGLLCTLLCFICLVRARLIRKIPVFSSYLLFVILATIANGVISPMKVTYWYFYVGNSFLDYLWQLAVLWEILSHLYSHISNRVSVGSGKIFAISLVTLAALSILLTIGVRIHNVQALAHMFLAVDAAFDVFRVFALISILALAFVFGLRWSNITLKIAVCLTAYAAIALAARAAQEFGDHIKGEITWFKIGDIVPISSWLLVMLFMSWQSLQYHRRESA